MASSAIDEILCIRPQEIGSHFVGLVLSPDGCNRGITCTSTCLRFMHQSIHLDCSLESCFHRSRVKGHGFNILVGIMAYITAEHSKTSTATSPRPAEKVRCKCGHLAKRLTSRSEKNPGRVFYQCYKGRDDPETCKFFGTSTYLD